MTKMLLSTCRRAAAAGPALRRQALSSRLMSVRAQAAATAKQGDFVSVDYTGTLDDGTVFDTSRKEGRKPLEFVVGGGMVSRLAPAGLLVYLSSRNWASWNDGSCSELLTFSSSST